MKLQDDYELMSEHTYETFKIVDARKTPGTERIWLGAADGVAGQWLSSGQVRELAMLLCSVADEHDARLACVPEPDTGD